MLRVKGRCNKISILFFKKKKHVLHKAKTIY